MYPSGKQFSACFHIPEVYNPGIPTCRQFFAIGAEVHRQGSWAKAPQCVQQLSSGRSRGEMKLPDFDVIISSCSRQQLSIRADGDADQRSAMADNVEKLLSPVQLPDFHRAVRTGSRQVLAILCECKAIDC